MPDRRAHRGPHPEDARLFAPAQRAALRAATDELSWLLGRGYTLASGLKLVGDRHALSQRQRAAVARCACAPSVAAARRARMLEPQQAAGRELWIDGFNVLTTLEVALSGGVVLRARDGVLRDIAGVHGSYRKVQETLPALGLLGALTTELRLARCCFLLDRPVSNSGRLRALIREHAAAHGLPWDARVVPNPDRVLVSSDPGLEASSLASPDPAPGAAGAEAPGAAFGGRAAGARVVASADGPVLDRCGPWLNLACIAVESAVADAFLVDLSS